MVFLNGCRLPRNPKTNKATGMDGIAGRQRQLNLGNFAGGQRYTKKWSQTIQECFFHVFSRNLPKHKVLNVFFNEFELATFLNSWMMQVWEGMFEFGMEESFERIAFHALPYKGQEGMFPRGRGIWEIWGILTGI